MIESLASARGLKLKCGCVWNQGLQCWLDSAPGVIHDMCILCRGSTSLHSNFTLTGSSPSTILGIRKLETTQPIMFTHLTQHSQSRSLISDNTAIRQHSQSRSLISDNTANHVVWWLCCQRWVNMIGCVVWGEWTWLAVLSEMSECDWLCCHRWVNVIGCVN